MTGAARITDEYVARSREPTSGLRDIGPSLPLSEALFDSIGGRVFGRPLFVDRDEIQQCAADVMAVFDMIVSLPDRLFGGDLFAYCAAMRLHPMLVPSLLRGYGRDPVLRYGRADLYHDGTAFRLLEFNIDSEIGGLGSAGELPRLFCENECFSAFANGRDLSFTQPAERLAMALREAAEPLANGREPVVALLQMGKLDPAEDDYHSRRSLQGVMRRLGLDFRYDTVAEVVEVDGRLYHQGSPIDVVVRAFSAYQIASWPDGRELTEPVFRVAEQGGVAIWTPLYSQLFMNKGCLALLSDPRYRDHFSVAELGVIDRIVPWTRALDPEVEPSAEPWLLLDKDQLMIKPNFLYGGIGVVAGWECDERAWIEALRESAQLGAVVQRRVVPRAEQAVDPVTGALENWNVAWGLFVTPAGYSGLYTRLMPEGGGSVITFDGNDRTRVAGVFTV